MNSIISKALVFAFNAHSSIDHRRKYTNEPYIVHPIAVADIVKQFGGSDAQIAAALLHDVVEDTPVVIREIVEEFGDEIASLVDDLTDVSSKSDGNRALRKKIDREHSANASKDAQFVKCADLIHNTINICEHDKTFAKVYIKEKKWLLDVMTKVHDTPIWSEAKRLVDSYYEEQ